MKVVVVFNSRSGTAAAEEEIERAFGMLGVECEVVPLSGEESEGRACEAARRCDVFVAAGGDGTVNAAAAMLVESGSAAALGLLPMGTANDFRRTLGLPDGWRDCAEAIVRGRSVPLDVVGMEDGRIMVNQANGGVSGRVAQEIEAETKGRWGAFGYWRASLDVAQDMPEYEVTAVIDGERLQTTVLNFSVANARYSGGGVPVAPDASISDGEMDIVIVESRMRIALLPLLPRILSGNHLGTDGVIFRRAKKLEFYSLPDMPFSVDGELREDNPRRFEVFPGRLRVRVPAGQ